MSDDNTKLREATWNALCKTYTDSLIDMIECDKYKTQEFEKFVKDFSEFLKIKRKFTSIDQKETLIQEPPKQKIPEEFKSTIPKETSEQEVKIPTIMKKNRRNLFPEKEPIEICRNHAYLSHGVKFSDNKIRTIKLTSIKIDGREICPGTVMKKAILGGECYQFVGIVEKNNDIRYAIVLLDQKQPDLVNEQFFDYVYFTSVNRAFTLDKE